LSLRRKLVSRAFRDVHLLAGAFLAFCGTVLALNAADMGLDYGRAVEVKGALIAKEMVRADEDNKRGTRFVARYRVALPDGQSLDAEEDLPRADWEARAIGSEHTVLYLSSSRKTLPGAASDRAGVAIMGAMGLLLLGGGLLLARAPARRLLERLRVARSGTLASAIVLDVFQTSTAVNRVILWQLRYRYRSPGGTELEGESELLRPEEAAAWRAGAEGEILVDPDRPEASVWLGRAPGEAQAPSPGPATWLWSKLRTLLRWAVRLALFFVALFAAAVAAELVPELKLADAWIEARRDELLIATIGAAIAGIFLLVGAVIVMLMEGGEPMDHTGVENQLRSMRDAQNLPYASRVSVYRLFGKGAGASGHEEFPLADFKRAVAAGAVLSDPVWRRRAGAAAGGMLILLGVFGVMIIVTPLALKILLAGVVLYALARITWAFARA